MMGAPKPTQVWNLTDNKSKQILEKWLISDRYKKHTLFTRADVEQARAEAFTSRHTEARVGRIHSQICKHLVGGNKTIPRDPLHYHVLRVQSVHRPAKQSHTQDNCENTTYQCKKQKRKKEWHIEYLFELIFWKPERQNKFYNQCSKVILILALRFLLRIELHFLILI